MISTNIYIDLRSPAAPDKEGNVFTSVDLDEGLFMKAWGLSGLRTKKALLEEALRVYVRLHEQAEVRSLRGKLVWSGDLSEVRGNRGAGSR